MTLKMSVKDVLLHVLNVQVLTYVPNVKVTMLSLDQNVKIEMMELKMKNVAQVVEPTKHVMFQPTNVNVMQVITN